jgi:UDP-2,3-diacylglucosamine hydrolase
MKEEDARAIPEREGVFLAVSATLLGLRSGIVQKPETLFLIAGNGSYPRLAALGAREAGVSRVVAAAFEGETDPVLSSYVDGMHWMRVGQLGRLLSAAKKSGATASMMAGQIAPGNLFDLRPDFRALFLLAKLRERNAETLFGAVAGELEKAGVPLLPATTFLEKHLAGEGLVAGPEPKERLLDDIAFGHGIAKEVSRLDIGQTVVVKKGTVLAVEGFDGTDATIRRGGELGKGESVVVKVSKPSQDMRFDVPVIGIRTLETAANAGISAIAVEARRTLLLEADRIRFLAGEFGITLWGIPS